MTAIVLSVSSPLNVRGQWILYWPPGFEGGQNGIEVDGCAAENLIPPGIGKRVQDRAAAAAHRRFSNTACAYRSFRIRNVERRPLHVDGYIQNGRRFRVIETQRNVVAILCIKHPLLTDGVSDPQRRSPENLPRERLGMNRGT